MTLADAPPHNRLGIFLSMLKRCEQTYNFTDPQSQYSLKETKRRYLNDISEYVSSTRGVFNERTYVPFINMVSANIFRTLPVSSTSVDCFEPDDDEPNFDPAWAHLQFVYELLRKFVISSIKDSEAARACITVEFVTALVGLFKTEDTRERDYLKTILHRIYGKLMPLRGPIRKAIMDVFHRVVYEHERHRGIGELLEILGSIINGFAVPLKEEHKQLLRKGLLPLHVPSSMPIYHDQLLFCVTQFAVKDARFAAEIINTLLRHWPVTQSRKEVLLLTEIEALIEVNRPEYLEGVIGPLFRRIGKCIESPHFQVAERALFYWNNEYIVNVMVYYREVVMRAVIGPLQRNLESHWNANVLSLSANVQRMLCQMDGALFEKSRKMYEAERRDEGKRSAERARRWGAVYRMAQKRFREKHKTESEGCSRHVNEGMKADVNGTTALPVEGKGQNGALASGRSRSLQIL